MQLLVVGQGLHFCLQFLWKFLGCLHVLQATHFKSRLAVHIRCTMHESLLHKICPCAWPTSATEWRSGQHAWSCICFSSSLMLFTSICHVFSQAVACFKFKLSLARLAWHCRAFDGQKFDLQGGQSTSLGFEPTIVGRQLSKWDPSDLR